MHFMACLHAQPEFTHVCYPGIIKYSSYQLPLGIEMFKAKCLNNESPTVISGLLLSLLNVYETHYFLLTQGLL